MRILEELQVSLGNEYIPEWREQSEAQKWNPPKRDAHIREANDLADPLIPEEKSLDLSRFRIEQDQPRPECGVPEEHQESLLRDPLRPIPSLDRINCLTNDRRMVRAGILKE